jgi:hypothetical protein
MNLHQLSKRFYTLFCKSIILCIIILFVYILSKKDTVTGVVGNFVTLDTSAKQMSPKSISLIRLKMKHEDSTIKSLN